MAVSNYKATKPQIWANYAQKLLENSLVGKSIASYETEANLSVGDTVNVPRIGRPIVQNYQSGVDNDSQTVDSVKESLVIDEEKYVAMDLEDKDKKQSNVNLGQDIVDKLSYELRNDIDAHILGETTKAKYTFDNNGSPYDLDSTDIQTIVSQSAGYLRRRKVEQDMPWVMVADPQTVEAISNKMVADGFNKADTTLTNGYKGDFLGYKIFESTNLPAEVVLGLATNPTDGDTITINEVEFIFVSSLAANEGEVLIGASADETAQNLVAAINGDSGAGSDYVELADDDRKDLARENVEATDGTDEVTVTASGYMEVTEDLTDGTDGFGDQSILHYFGRMGGISFAMQIAPDYEMNRYTQRKADQHSLYDVYGSEVFTEGAERFGKIKIKA